MMTVAVARSSSGDSAICYLLPVLYTTSCFDIMGPTGQNKARYVASSLPDGDTVAQLLSAIADLFY